MTKKTDDAENRGEQQEQPLGLEMMSDFVYALLAEEKLPAHVVAFFGNAFETILHGWSKKADVPRGPKEEDATSSRRQLLVIDALALKGKPGREAATPQERARRWEMAVEVLLLRRTGASLDHAIAEVAEKNGISDSTVKRYWKMYRDDLAKRGNSSV